MLLVSGRVVTFFAANKQGKLGNCSNIQGILGGFFFGLTTNTCVGSLSQHCQLTWIFHILKPRRKFVPKEKEKFKS